MSSLNTSGNPFDMEMSLLEIIFLFFFSLFLRIEDCINFRVHFCLFSRLLNCLCIIQLSPISVLVIVAVYCELCEDAGGAVDREGYGRLAVRLQEGNPHVLF